MKAIHSLLIESLSLSTFSRGINKCIYFSDLCGQWRMWNLSLLSVHVCVNIYSGRSVFTIHSRKSHRFPIYKFLWSTREKPTAHTRSPVRIPDRTRVFTSTSVILIQTCLTAVFGVTIVLTECLHIQLIEMFNLVIKLFGN